MKTGIIFLILSALLFAQPTVRTKIQKPAAGKTYTFYLDIKNINTASVLVEDLDIGKTNVSSYIVPLTNVTVSGDTTFGEITIPVSTVTQYLTGGIVASSTGKKPSLMKIKQLTINPRETKPLFFDMVEK